MPRAATRHSVAIEPLRDSIDVRTIQTLPGHEDLATTMIYGLADRGPMGARIPSSADALPLDGTSATGSHPA